MREVCYKTEMILQITKFGPWNRVDYIYQPSRLSLVTSPMPPCMLPETVGTTLKQGMLYLRKILQYNTSGIFVYVRIMRS